MAQKLNFVVFVVVTFNRNAKVPSIGKIESEIENGAGRLTVPVSGQTTSKYFSSCSFPVSRAASDNALYELIGSVHVPNAKLEILLCMRRGGLLTVSTTFCVIIDTSTSIAE